MQATSLRAPAAPDAAMDPVRLRLLAGFAEAVSAHGYAAITIADVVRGARVSKRTFYEHFADKEECFLAAYAFSSEGVIAAMASAVDPRAPWEDQIRMAAGAYLASLEAQPALARAFLLEIQAAGPRALAMRREVHRRFADTLRALVRAGRKRHPTLRPLSAAMATVVVGGINELVIVALQEDRGARLSSLAGTVTELVRAVLLVPPRETRPSVPPKRPSRAPRSA